VKMRGTVVRGAGRGRGLGFPTANILPAGDFSARGVYSSRVALDGAIYDAITNVGTNPTFGNGQISIETHIFDFDEDIAGREIEIELIEHIRDEKKFTSVDELISQIKKDIINARNP